MRDRSDDPLHAVPPTRENEANYNNSGVDNTKHATDNYFQKTTISKRLVHIRVFVKDTINKSWSLYTFMFYHFPPSRILQWNAGNSSLMGLVY